MSSAQAAGLWLKSKLPVGAKLTSDSRAVTAGDGFIAFPGLRADGRRYVQAAFDAGAKVCVFDADFSALSNSDSLLGVNGLRQSAGIVASYFYEQPSLAMNVVAITGTNGKTSCSHWIAQGLANNTCKAGILGTLGSGFVDAHGASDLADFGLTTPDAVSLQHQLSQMLKAGTQHVVMEASSIGIVQKRIEGTEFAVAVFTNLTRDHLDVHGSMAAYGQAKAMLFAKPSLRAVVLNLNDAASGLMLSQVDTAKPCLTVAYGIASQEIFSLDVQRRVIASDLCVSDLGTAFTLTSEWGNAHIQLKLHGQFNVSNALAVAATLLSSNIPFDDVCNTLAKLVPIAGRMQKIDTGGGVCVFVDYAHTPDALSKTLEALAPLARQRHGHLWCVFGAGGDRDPGKRPEMAKAVQALAEQIVVTSDNPRSEDPQEIVDQIMAGFAASSSSVKTISVQSIIDRAKAVEYAVCNAGNDDVVLIAGKGHETYQEISGVKHSFSDAAVVLGAISKKQKASAA